MTRNRPTSRSSARQLDGKTNFRSLLAGGDRRSIGRSNHVATLVEGHPHLVDQLVKLLWDSDTLVSMRAADALEKISRGKGSLLQPHKAQLLGLLAEAKQQELRWHLAVMVPRLRLTPGECGRVATVLKTYLDDRSSIVKTSAMQGLFDLSAQDPGLRLELVDMLRALARSGTPAMRARGRRLAKQLELNDL